MNLFNRQAYHVLFDSDEYRYSLRGLGILFVVYMGALAFSALISPWVYQFVQVLNNHFEAELWNYLAHKSYPDFFDRLRWPFVLIGLPWMFLQCRLVTARRIGFKAERPWHFYFVRFFSFGVISLLIVVVLQVGLGHTVGKEALPFTKIASRVISGIIAACLIAILEETVFRGLIFRMFYTAVQPVPAIILASLFFAYTHFKMPDELWTVTDPAQVGFTSGWYVAWWTLAGIFKQFHLLLFVNLTLIGYILIGVFIRTRSLWACIGLHAGWVSLALTYKKLFRITAESVHPFWGSNALADGWLTTLLLIAVACWVTFLYRPRKRTIYE